MNRALARLNGGDEAVKKLGIAYSDVNRAKIAAQRAAHAAAGVIPLEPWQQDLLKRRTHSVPKSVSERAVPVPRVGVGRRYEPPPPIAFVPHRKTADEVRLEHNGYKRDKAPRCAPTRSADERKDELAMRRQFAGKTPEEIARETVESGRPRRGAADVPPALTEEEQIARMRDDIADEIAERQDFLDQMVAAGRSNEYAAQIQAEIAERMADMRKLDALARDGN